MVNDFTFGPFGNSLGIGPFLFAASPGSDYVSSIDESAIYWGRDGNDTFLLATDADNPRQIDLVLGDLVDATLFPEVGSTPRDWQNRFILGDWQRPYYVSNLPSRLGLNQFAVIADFDPSQDMIQLHGSSEDYQLIESSGNTAIYWQQEGERDLVALFPLASDLSLESDYFQFQGDTPPGSSVLETIQQLGTDGIDSLNRSTTDSLGNVYVAGVTKDNILAAKYDNNGNQLWIQDFGTSDYEAATDLVSDREGNLYLVGVTNGDLAEPNAGSFDVWLAKYDSDGNQLWIEQFGNELVDLSYSINVDSNGNVYLSGHSGKAAPDDEQAVSGQILDSWVTKYDSDGNRLWFQEFENTGFSEAYGVVVDSNDNVYATGWTLGDFGGENAGLYDIWLAQLDSDGNPVWREQFGSEDYEFSWGIDTDSQGNIYTTGWTLSDLGEANAGSYDAWVAKYDSEGNQLWIQQFGTSGQEGPSTFFGGIEVDSNDDIFLTGYTDNNLGGTNAGSYDAWVAKYDSNGNQLWIQQFGTPELDYAGGISADNSGNLYVTGITEGSLGDLNAGAVDGWIAKLDAESGILKDFSDNFDTPEGEDLDLTEDVPTLAAEISDNRQVDLTGFSDRSIQANLLSVNSDTAFSNTVGFYAIEDTTGTVIDEFGNTLNPGDTGYAAAAIANSLLEIDANTSDPIQLTGGDLLAPYIIANGTTEGFLTQNPENLETGNAIAYFSFLGANPDGVEHIRLEDDNTLAFEDLLDGGDQDFDDFSLQVKFDVVTEEFPARAIRGQLEVAEDFEVEPSDSVEVTVTTEDVPTLAAEISDNRQVDLTGFSDRSIQANLLSVNSDTAFSNTVGFYAIEDTTGTVIDEFGNTLNPGDTGYAAAAIANSLLEIDANTSDPIQLTGGDLLAPYIIANGTTEGFLTQNPENLETGNAIAYFSFLGANPDGVEHIRLEDDNTLAFEDLLTGGDEDFDDFSLQVKFDVV